MNQEQQQTCDTIIYANYILTQNESRECHENYAIVISNGRIVAIADAQSVRNTWKAKQELNLSNTILLPGLINTHTHAPMTYLRGYADDLPLMKWLTDHIFPVEQKMNREIVRISAQLGFAEMLRTGTTACIDMYMAKDCVLDAAHETGIRCQGGEAIILFPTLGSSSGEATLDIVRKHVEQFQGKDRLSVCVMLHSVYTTDKELMAKSVALADELHLPIHIHVAENKDETAQSLKQWGMRPVELCQEMGLLRKGTTLIHAVDITLDEINLLAKNNVNIAHCPSSNMKLASGVAPVVEMRKAGLCVGLGTDGSASNNRLNMFTEMREAALLHKVFNLDATVMSAQEVLDMATREGGRIFSGLDSDSAKQRLGVLEVGHKADIIAVSLDEAHMHPMYEPASHLTYVATGMEVCMTMIDGEILYDHGKYTRFDYDELLKQFKKLPTIRRNTAK